MSTQMVLSQLPNYLTKAPEVTRLSIPQFDTEDEAIHYLSILNKMDNLAKWEMAYILAGITTEYGESTFARACEEAGINQNTAGRLRWMGQTWPLSIVRRFGNLTHKHYAEVTALMNDLLATQDHTRIEELLTVLMLADQGYQKPSGAIVPYSSSWVKREAELRLRNLVIAAPEPSSEATEDDDIPVPAPYQASQSKLPDSMSATIRGQLFHDPAIPMEDGSSRPAIILLLEDRASMDYLVRVLQERGLYGQYVSSNYWIDHLE